MKFFKKLKETTIYFTPDIPGKITKRYKYSALRVLGYAALYTFGVMFFVTLFLALTPARNIVFFPENEELKKQAVKINELEKNIYFLTKELRALASTNKKLEYAIILGDSSGIDTASSIYDSLRIPDNDPEYIEGNIFGSIINYFFKKNESDKNSVYFIKPADGFIIKNFDPSKGHMGMDFAVKNETPIYAAAGGYIIFSDYTVDDGNMIIIKHDNGYLSVYKHCSLLLKNAREVVNQGEVIALSGNSGYNTTGPHLHFEIWKNGRVLDPNKVIVN